MLHYDNIERGIFLRRLNRFVAEVEINGVTERTHVRNTGRCSSVLSPGCEVSLQRSADPNRATPYTLIAANTKKYGWVNLDSLAPNKLAAQWLTQNGFENIRPEFPFGESRLDFYAEKNCGKYLVEVKGCTLEKGGAGRFPDAPTSRGAKHLRELSAAVQKGYRPVIAFVIMLSGVHEVLPNAEIDPEFAAEFDRAKSAGVSTEFICCRCTADEVSLL